MKTHVIKKIFFTATVVASLGAAILPQHSVAQDQPVPPENASVPVAPTVLPPDISPASPLAQVIKLTQAGVSRNVILTFIANSGRFNLDTDKIIYLSDLGIPDEFITAMMQRDESLRQQTDMDIARSASPPATEVATTTTTEVTDVNFDDTLAPYGGWVQVEGYGRCWRPTVAFYDTGWQPYSDRGHWIYTDAGWYWASDYSWGATFHYGRWFRDSRFGWCWWPDTTWAPSWVAWRYTDDYCGWAPLPPRTEFQSGVGFIYQGRNVSVSFDFGLGADCFTFVQTRDFCDPHPHEHRAAPEQVRQIFNNTTIINNYNINSSDRTVINNGIPPERISNATHNEIHRVNIHESSAPVPRGEQLVRDTLIVNRPHFAAHPNPAAPHGDTPHATTPTTGHEQDSPRPVFTRDNGNATEQRNPQQPHNNNFSQPVVNPNPQPETPQRPVRIPQDHRDGDSAPVVQHQPPAQNPAPGTPFQPQPGQQPGQTGAPRNSTRSPDAQRNVDATLQAPVAQPAANHFMPQQSQPVQHNFTPRQNEATPGDTRPSRAEPPSAIAVQPRAPQQNQFVTPSENHTAPLQPVSPPQRNFTPRQNDLPSADTRPSRVEPPSVIQPQPQSPPAQAPAGAAAPQASQRNSGRQDKNQNGQQQ